MDKSNIRNKIITILTFFPLLVSIITYPLLEKGLYNVLSIPVLTIILGIFIRVINNKYLFFEILTIGLLGFLNIANFYFIYNKKAILEPVSVILLIISVFVLIVGFFIPTIDKRSGLRLKRFDYLDNKSWKRLHITLGVIHIIGGFLSLAISFFVEAKYAVFLVILIAIIVNAIIFVYFKLNKK